MNLDRGTRVGVVGAGRLGASLAVAMSRAGYAVVALCRRDATAARAVAARIEGAVGSDDPAVVAASSDLVLVTTTDAQISQIVRSLHFGPGQAVVHCSGATPLTALSSARASGALVGGMHPLQTFPTEYGADRFGGITFGVESPDERLLGWIRTLVRDLGARSISIPEGGRAAYHASAVMVSGLVAGLAGLAAELWGPLGETRASALEALSPLLAATAADVGTLGMPESLTGPFTRGDVDVIRGHLDALERAGEQVLGAYAHLALAHLPMLAEQGRAPAQGLDEIEAILRERLDRSDRRSDAVRRSDASRTGDDGGTQNDDA